MENNTNQKLFTPLVFVRCLTFNHEAYIEDALNGFVIQQTNFPFIVTIVNDASPDNTKNVIKTFIKKICDSSSIQYEQTSYADIIKATPNNNSNCFLYVLNLYENHFQKKSHRPYYQEYVDKAKYWAECEGDDYWTDPLKLQKQVDFMEANPGYVLCCHRYKIYNQNDGTWNNDSASHILNSYPNGYVFTNKENLNVGWFTKTMTLLIRNDALKNMPNTRGFKYWRDFHINYYLLKQGGGFCFPFDGAVYRRHDGSVHSSKSLMDKNKMAYCVAREVWDRNMEDKDLLRLIITLHPTFLEYLRYKIERNNFKNLFKEILYFSRMDVKINGIKGVVFSIRKMLLSLFRLLKLK